MAVFSKLVDLIKESPYFDKRTQPILYNIPHCTAAHMTAARIGKSFEHRDPGKEASCNYGCGSDGLIIGIADETKRSWCTSSAWADQRGITFEISSEHDAPNKMDPLAFEAWKRLSVEIMLRYNKDTLLYIPDAAQAKAYQVKDNEMVILLHRWFKNKACPGEWMLQQLPAAVAEINARVKQAKQTSTEEPQEPAADLKTPEEYTVKKGDSLSKIGVIYGYTADELAAYNGIKNKNLIFPGQIIKIPPREKKKTLEYKTLPVYFEASAAGKKDFEIREDDRDIAEGDAVILREHDGTDYTGRTLERKIKYILRNVPEYGLKEGFVIIGFET